MNFRFSFSNYLKNLKEEYSNEFHYLKFNLSWLTNRTLTTEIVTVSMTKRCNLNCSYCWDFGAREKIPEMSTADIFKIIDDAKAMGAQVFNCLGGEPFIRKDTTDIIKYALKSGLKVSLATNGTLIPEDKCEEVIKSALPGKLCMCISLDGYCEEENDYIRDVGSFKKTVKTIETLQRFREHYKTGVSLIMNTVVSRNNFRSMFKQLELSKKLKVDAILFLTPVVSSNLIHLEMKERKLIIQPHEFAELDLIIDQLLIEKSKNPGTILNQHESLKNFKDYYRRQYTLHEEALRIHQNTSENLVSSQA